MTASDLGPVVSLSEIQALCTKAARGAGFAWGMAEEAGVAALRLSAAGLPGPELLLACLIAPAGASPAPTGRHWADASGGWLCPLATGAALADRAALLARGMDEPVVLERVLLPALLLAFLQPLAHCAGSALVVDWDGGAATVGAAGIACADSEPALRSSRTQRVTIALASGEAGPPPRRAGHCVSAEIWRGLEALALETTVPATEGSRAGAGARTPDND